MYGEKHLRTNPQTFPHQAFSGNYPRKKLLPHPQKIFRENLNGSENSPIRKKSGHFPQTNFRQWTLFQTFPREKLRFPLGQFPKVAS